MPRPALRVLDIGYGAGGNAELLRAAGAIGTSRIEVVPEAAVAAERVYDQACAGDALAMLHRVSGRFEAIVCYDVLEISTTRSR